MSLVVDGYKKNIVMKKVKWYTARWNYSIQGCDLSKIYMVGVPLFCKKCVDSPSPKPENLHDIYCDS